MVMIKSIAWRIKHNPLPSFDKHWRYNWQQGDGYESFCLGLKEADDASPITRMWLGSFLDWASVCYGQIACWLLGCNIEMESSIGPDSGREWWHCPRCGCGGQHTYY